MISVGKRLSIQGRKGTTTRLPVCKQKRPVASFVLGSKEFVFFPSKPLLFGFPSPLAGRYSSVRSSSDLGTCTVIGSSTRRPGGRDAGVGARRGSIDAAQWGTSECRNLTENLFLFSAGGGAAAVFASGKRRALVANDDLMVRLTRSNILVVRNSRSKEPNQFVELQPSNGIMNPFYPVHQDMLHNFLLGCGRKRKHRGSLVFEVLDVLQGDESRVHHVLGGGSEFNPTNLAFRSDPQMIIPPLVGQIDLEIIDVFSIVATRGLVLLRLPLATAAAAYGGRSANADPGPLQFWSGSAFRQLTSTRTPAGWTWFFNL